MRSLVRAQKYFRQRHVIATSTVMAVAIGVFGAGALTLSSQASAQEPAVVVVPQIDRTAPFTASEKAALLTRAQQLRGQLAFQEALAAKQAEVADLRAKVVRLAKAQIGDRYSAGATGPSAFDCSGLTKYVFKTAAGKELPHQSHAQYAKVKKIKLKDAEPGDLVFFFNGGAHHVGIYIGNKKMVDAVGYGSGVRISPISGSWWSRTYSGVGRILPA